MALSSALQDIGFRRCDDHHFFLALYVVVLYVDVGLVVVVVGTRPVSSSQLVSKNHAEHVLM